jgi:4-amino-4-deoxy-L-arabinose transferase-like glycosyltransferase
MTSASQADRDDVLKADNRDHAEARVWWATSSRGLDCLGMALVLIAVVLRLLLWGQQRSLWIDEARLSLNVASRSYMNLLPPLDYDQSAPLGYLWLQRSAIALFGVNEGSLRLLALAAGIGTVVLTFRLARSWFGQRVAVLAMAIAALSPTLIYYSGEAKQYGIEACITCGVLYAAMRSLENPSSTGRWRLLVGFGVLAPWLAFPAVFALAGVGITTLLDQKLPVRRRVQVAGQLAAWWGGSLALAYLLVYRAAAHDRYLHHYWNQAFLAPWRPGGLLDTGVALQSILWGPVSVLWGPMPRLIPGTPNDLAIVVFAPAVCIVIALLVVVGARRLARTLRIHLVVLALAPVVLVILASLMQLYPISARTMMFCIPIIIILAAAGIEEIARLTRKPILACAVMSAACLPLAWVAVRELAGPPREHIRPLIEALQMYRRAGEPVYVLAGAIPAWAMYTTNWRAPDTARLDYLSHIGRAGGPAFENAPSRGHRVVREGNDLTYPTRWGPEIYGIPHGLEARVFGLTNPLPDSGWAENEVRRIREVASPGAWLILSHFYGPEGQLLSALDASGGHLTYKDFRNGAALFHYEFPHSGAATDR